MSVFLGIVPRTEAQFDPLTPAADPLEATHLRSPPPPSRRFSRVTLTRTDDQLRGACIGRRHQPRARRRIDRAVGDRRWRAGAERRGNRRRYRYRWDRRATWDWPGRTARPISANCRRRPSRLAASIVRMPWRGRSGRAPRREPAPDCGTSRSVSPGGAHPTIMWCARSLASRPPAFKSSVFPAVRPVTE